MEAQDPGAITVADLTSALLAKAAVGQPLSFHHTLSQHRDVLESMSAHEAQQLFSAAMSHLTQHFQDDMLALAKVAWQVAACSELGSGAGGQLAAEQLQQLVEVHLSCGQTQQALTLTQEAIQLGSSIQPSTIAAIFAAKHALCGGQCCAQASCPESQAETESQEAPVPLTAHHL